MEKSLRGTAATRGEGGRLRAARALTTHGALLLCLSFGPPGMAQHHQPAAAPSSTSATGGRRVSINDVEYHIPDVALIDQDGNRVRLYSDLLKGRVFLLGFFYTDCTFVCARQGNLFARLQERLGERLGREVFIVSVSMNPQRDTPAQLSRWAKRFKRRPGWTLVTGQVAEVQKLLDNFTGNPAGPSEIHSGVFYIVNDKTGRAAFGDELTPVAEVVRRLDELSGP